MRKRRSGVDDTPGQLLIAWNGTGTVAASGGVDPAAIKATNHEPSPLVQRLPWDFCTTFPQPLPEAIEMGILDESDLEPENLASLHQNYANQLLGTLSALDSVMDARRRGVDPATGTVPKTSAAKERLRKYLSEEPGRLENTFAVLMGTYGTAFGDAAADAFTKAIRARHAGIDVVVETPPSRVMETQAPSPPQQECIQPPAAEPSPSPQNHPAATNNSRRRIIARLPVPRPLPEAVRAGRFGIDERGKPIFPGPDEVHAITVNHAQKLIDLLGTRGDYAQKEFQLAVAAYAEDFGEAAAARLEAYARRKEALGETADPPTRRGR